METQKNSNELGRKLGLGAVIALGVGTTVGSGIFSSLSDKENLKGTVKELPARSAIDVPVDEMLIVELYSK